MINKDNVGQEQVQQPEFQSMNQEQAQQSYQPQQPPRWSFHTGQMLGAPISRSIGSDVYIKLKENLTEMYKQTTDKNLEIALIDLDNINEPALAFSSIIVAMRNKAHPEAGVAFHILILEATGEKLYPFMDTINGQQVEILKMPSDAYDDILVSKAREKVSKAFPNTEIHIVDSCVIPATFNPDDKYAVHRIALNAGLACGTEIEMNTKDFIDVNLAGATHDSSLNINVGFNRQTVEDAVGHPMRSDVLLNFESRRDNRGKATSVNSGDREVKIAELSGFVDLLWSPVNPVSAFNPYAPMAQQMNTQKYAPRLVITNLVSNHSYTIASMLMNIATSMSIRDDSNWIQAFRPMAVSDREIDMTDIGALNIEANLNNDPSGIGTRIDTKSDSFKLEDLGQLVAALIQPGLVISIDVPDSGPQTWYTHIFSIASEGHPGAYRRIFEAAQVLTNGFFGQAFKYGEQMFVDQGNRIHNGYWIDKNGQKRDIRDFDHLAVCNLVGERNPQFIKDWSDTFLRVQYPIAMRLSARKKMIQALSSETAVFTGFSTRVTFSAPFLSALSAAIQATGLSVRVNTPLTGSDFSNQRGVANFVGNALLQPGQTFMTPGGYSFAPNQGMFQQNYRF